MAGIVFERGVNFNYVREMAKTCNGKEYKIVNDDWITELLNKSSVRIVGDAGTVIGTDQKKL